MKKPVSPSLGGGGGGETGFKTNRLVTEAKSTNDRLFERFPNLYRAKKGWIQDHQLDKRKTEKTGVGFGRTELSLKLLGRVLYALSHGHGLRIQAFQGVLKKCDS